MNMFNLVVIAVFSAVLIFTIIGLLRPRRAGREHDTNRRERDHGSSLHNGARPDLMNHGPHGP